MIKIEIHDDLIDWLHNRLVLSTREECVEFVQELVSFATMTKAMTVENTDLLAERDALRVALEALADLARSPENRVKMTQLQMCGFLDAIMAVVTSTLGAEVAFGILANERSEG